MGAISVFDLLEVLFSKLGILILLAFFVSKSKIFKNYFVREELSLKTKLVFSIILGLFGVVGTLSGIHVNGAIVNSRSVGVIVAGLFGGPFVGGFAGLIAGVHRMLLPTGRFTALACGLSTIIGGLLAGYCSNYVRKQENKWISGVLITIVIEGIQMLIILLISRPFVDALDLVKLIFIPMAFINAFGTGVFILLIEQINTESELTAASKASLALKIATKTLPLLRKGLNQESANAVCNIILKESDVDAVSLTNDKTILAHVGSGSNHHLVGEKLHTRLSLTALNEGRIIIANKKNRIECDSEDCNLSSVAIVPIKEKDKIIGLLKLYKTVENGISISDIELTKGLAYLISTQLELSQISHQEEMIIQSELKALQAQIQPHFLFNALNTIGVFCRTDGEKARELITKLSDYLRARFQTKKEMIYIQEEIEYVKKYLDIEMARFKDRLVVSYEIDENLSFMVPPLILQPLVENSLKHAFKNKIEDCQIQIIVKDSGPFIELTVCDNGESISKQTVANLDSQGGVGLKNVIDRIKYIYGTDVMFVEVETGTCIKIVIPSEKVTRNGDERDD